MALQASKRAGYGARPHVAKRDALRGTRRAYSLPNYQTLLDVCPCGVVAHIGGSSRSALVESFNLASRPEKQTRSLPTSYSLISCTWLLRGQRDTLRAASGARRSGRGASNSLIHVIKLKKPNSHAA